MNLAFFLTPKVNVAFLFEDFTVRQGLEKLRAAGYAAIPVLDREGHYIGTAGEGDFLWYLTENCLSGAERLESLPDAAQVRVRDIMRSRPNPPVLITAGIDELIDQAINNNFVPVIDDRGFFVGIVTRKAIISALAEKTGKQA